MLTHRLRRWPNIETASGEWPVFAGILAINLLAAEGETSPVFVYKNGESSSFCIRIIVNVYQQFLNYRALVQPFEGSTGIYLNPYW